MSIDYEKEPVAAYSIPPANFEEAVEKTQLIYEPDKVLFQKATEICLKEEEAKEVIRASFESPYNLLDTKWNSVKEFVAAFSEMSWVVKVKEFKDFHSEKRKTFFVKVTSQDKTVSITFLMTDKGYITTVDNITLKNSFMETS